MDDDQGAEPPLKTSCLPRWARITLRVFGIFVVLLYTYFQVGYRLMYEKGYSSTQDLFSIAQGHESSDIWAGEVPIEWVSPAPKSLSHEPACSISSENGSAIEGVLHNVSYSSCVYLHPWGGGPGCAWWRFEFCEVYEADDFILTQSDLLGRTLRALKEPCVFLPKAEEFRKAERLGHKIPVVLRKLYEKYACSAGGKAVSEKVVINIIDDHRNLLAQYIHYPPDD